MVRYSSSSVPCLILFCLTEKSYAGEAEVFEVGFVRGGGGFI